MRWPDGFMWGSGASSTQCEGAAPASDWIDWERAGRAPASGDGNGFATRYAEDFRLLADLGLTHHRLSVEWARIEPDDGVVDHAAVEHYRDVLTTARDAGITPWVTLHHFTLPRWFAAAGGFADHASRTGAWTRHVERIAETFGDLVGGWQPMNEFNFYPRIAYRGGGFPPSHDDRDEAALVDEVVQLANAEAAVRLGQTGRPVASIFQLTDVIELDDTPETHAAAQAWRAELWEPGLGLHRDGVLRVPGRDPVERPDLARAFDLIGFSYYTCLGIEGGRIVLHPADAPVSPLGYGIWPDGLGVVLDRLHACVPDAPLLVAEYGIGTADDDQRAEYLREGLAVVQQALARGIDVRGFFHWTAVDNYEWLHGFDRTTAFGLIDRDRNVRPSAQVLAAEARSNRD